MANPILPMSPPGNPFFNFFQVFPLSTDLKIPPSGPPATNVAP